MEEKKNRTKWLHLRLTPSEYRQLHSRFQKTTCRKLSDYLRAVIFDKSVITKYRNTSIDDALAEMGTLNKELNAIGNNINQMAKRIHTIQLPEMASWLLQFDKLSKEYFIKMDEVKSLLRNLSERWLR